MFSPFASVSEQRHRQIPIVELTPFVYCFSELLLLLLDLLYLLFLSLCLVDLQRLIVFLLNDYPSLNVLQLPVLRHQEGLRINNFLLLGLLVLDYFYLNSKELYLSLLNGSLYSLLLPHFSLCILPQLFRVVT
jgi:hypothetical protein